jgi:hypothetical protein
MPNAADLSRRSFFGLATGAALSRPTTVQVEPAVSTTSILAGGTAAEQHRTGPTMQVAGPRDSELAAWARRLQAPLALGLNTGDGLMLRYAGGVDGVIGANQFDARVLPDGQTALFLPGSVALSWLAGKGPVRFDPSHMLTLLAVYGPGILMVRNGALDPIAAHGGLQHAPRRPLRLAAGSVPEAALPAMLGLHLRGIPFTPVATGMPTIVAAKAGMADAVFIYGWEASKMAPAFLATGFSPAFSSRLDGHAGTLDAPSFLSGLPASRLQDDPLVAAWRAVASASALCAALLVPRLTPAAAIGRWRHAESACILDQDLAAQAQHQALHLAGAESAATALAPMQVSDPVQLALHRWIAGRLRWQASE